MDQKNSAVEKHTPQIHRSISSHHVLRSSRTEAIPCHKSSLSRSWHDEKFRVDTEAAKKKKNWKNTITDVQET